MKGETIQFRIAVDPVIERATRAQSAILKLFEAGHPIMVGYSGGKDSSAVASLVLAAAKRFTQAGGKPFVLMTTSNTGVENPEIVAHYERELANMEDYGREHGFTVHTRIVSPSLASTWQIKILSGRGLPSFPGKQSDCSVDLKVTPQKTFRNALFRDMKKAGMPEPVICIGTRFDESARREAHMRGRGEHSEIPVRNKDGELILSPIAEWSEDDVFEHLGYISNGLIEAYSDMKEVDRIYAHSAGTSCSVVAQAIHSENKMTGGCGARHGCFVCQKTEDKSMEAMLAFDSRYAYATGLNKLNKFIRNTRYDWSLRHYVGRQIKGGYVEIKPDTYHPKFLRQLTRYMLQLDHDERRRAERAGERPKFEILPPKMIIAVDAMQSAQGVARPYQIWADYRDITRRGIRYDIPDVEPVPQTPMPPTKYLHVGEEWDGDGGRRLGTGLRDHYIEGITEGSNCAPALTHLKDGTAVWDLETQLQFEVHEESALMIEDFELDRLLAQYDAGYSPSGITGAYKWYVQYGALSLHHSHLTKHDEILRRTAFKDRLGLTLEYSVDDLYARAVSFADLPQEAKDA